MRRLKCILYLLISLALFREALCFVSLSKPLTNGLSSSRSHVPQPTQLPLLPGSTYPYVKEALLVNGFIGTTLSIFNQRSLTGSGLLHATALGVGLWSFLNFQGWLLCVSYFGLGSLATKVKMREKEVL